MNIGDIAQRTGVSRSTVSYALSGRRSVSTQTEQRIQAARHWAESFLPRLLLSSFLLSEAL
jgi:transcriptional regulator with XRE-family HTH domain